MDLAKVLAGQTPSAVVTLETVSSGVHLEGRLTSAVPWLQISQPTLNGSQVQIVAKTAGLATRQIHTGRIDVVCNAGQASIEVKVNVTEPPKLNVNIKTLNFGAVDAREEPVLRLIVSNSGGGTLQGNVSGAPNWLRLSSATFSGDRTELRLAVRGPDLPAVGVHKTTLSLTSNGGTEYVDVVASGMPTTLAVEPASLDFGRQPYSRRIRRKLILHNRGLGVLHGGVAVNAPWLTVEPASFTGNRAEIIVVANTGSLTPDKPYQSTVTVTSNGGNINVSAKLQVSSHGWIQHHLYHNRWVQLAALVLFLLLATTAQFALTVGAPVGRSSESPTVPVASDLVATTAIAPAALSATMTPTHISLPTAVLSERPAGTLAVSPTLGPTIAEDKSEVQPAVATPTATPFPTATSSPTDTLPPTSTSLPTPTLTPVPTVPTPTPLPTTPAPTPTAGVVLLACPDARAVITSPGNNQVIQGLIAIRGTAVHEEFQFFKLEYAPGANARDGFSYLAGGQIPLENGLIAEFHSRTLPNGTYTLRLTVVDRSGNYPPPCQVTVVIRN